MLTVPFANFFSVPGKCLGRHQEQQNGTEQGLHLVVTATRYEDTEKITSSCENEDDNNNNNIVFVSVPFSPSEHKVHYMKEYKI